MTFKPQLVAKIVSTLSVESPSRMMRPYLSNHLELHFVRVPGFSARFRTKIFSSSGGKTYFGKARSYVKWLFTHRYIDEVTRLDFLLVLGDLEYRIGQIASDGEMTTLAAELN